jgi:hypothetical protein
MSSTRRTAENTVGQTSSAELCLEFHGKSFFEAFITPRDEYHHAFYLMLDEAGLTSYKCKS